jgi:hypothetical protein
MSTVPAESLKCAGCERIMDACACCDERDCPPPICYTCLSEDLAKSRRPLYVHAGASLTEG